jgi:hypothetical protein
MTIVLNGTTGITNVNGTAAAPAETGTDTDSGIVYGTNTVSLATNGTTAVTVDASQNVGIGTASPSQKLDVRGQGYFQSTSADAVVEVNSSGGSGRSYQIRSQSTGQFYVYDNTAGSARMVIDSSGNLQFNSGYGSVATAYGCRAWVNFNGTGTPAIIASGNVSSLTDDGLGRYRLNLTTALPDINFALSGNASIRDAIDDANSGVVAIRRSTSVSITTSAIPIQTTYYGASGTFGDFPLVSVMVIR